MVFEDILARRGNRVTQLRKILSTRRKSEESYCQFYPSDRPNQGHGVGIEQKKKPLRLEIAQARGGRFSGLQIFSQP
jgi:hypothetical protein